MAICICGVDGMRCYGAGFSFAADRKLFSNACACVYVCVPRVQRSFHPASIRYGFEGAVKPRRRDVRASACLGALAQPASNIYWREGAVKLRHRDVRAIVCLGTIAQL